MNKLINYLTEDSVGANDYESLIRIVSQIIGERLTKENFNLAKTITL